VVICLERGADLHTAQLMPLSLTVSCFSKIQIGFTFLVPAHPGSPGQRAVKCVCACVCVCVCEREREREHSRRKLSPTLAAAHYSSHNNATGPVAQCVLSGYVKLGWLLEAVGRKFSDRPGNPATAGLVRWRSAGDTALAMGDAGVHRPKLTPVSLISMPTAAATVSHEMVH